MSALDERMADIAAAVPGLASGIFAGLGLPLTPGLVSNGRDPARPMAPESSIAVAANLLGIDGRVAGRLVVATTAEAAAALIEAGGPSEALVSSIAEQLRRLPEPASSLIADRFAVSDGTSALAGVAREHDPDPTVVTLDSGPRHLATVALALTADLAGGSSATADLPTLADTTAGHAAGAARPLASLGEVQLAVTVELGRTELPLRELLGLQPGAVVQLDRTLREPVDVYANGTLIARGEMVVVDDSYGVRVTELVEGD